MQYEVHGYHWSNSRATLHPFHVSWYDHGTETVKFKTNMVISDSLKHDTDHFDTFRAKVIHNKSEACFEKITKVYISDGVGSQYKNCKNVCHIFNRFNDIGLLVEWIYTATTHGKSVRFRLRRGQEDSKNFAAMSHSQARNYYKTYVLFSSEDVKQSMPNILARNEKALKVIGTQKLHSIKVVGTAFSNDGEYIDLNYVKPSIEQTPASLGFTVGEFVGVKSVTSNNFWKDCRRVRFLLEIADGVISLLNSLLSKNPGRIIYFINSTVYEDHTLPTALASKKLPGHQTRFLELLFAEYNSL
ncbi:unnamed protein product [Allacma fusca]|uniref:Uncharacterized protein n=1 Tax=Allacma fusca TaxID=39272 RepID=A0A8J2PVD8_9HEXA|nr:unnamed protein product [Allacma fusca]